MNTLLIASIFVLCLYELTYYIRLSMKIEEDAIVIDDSDMIAQTLSAPDTHKSPGNTYFDVQLAICKEDNLDDDPNVVINRRLTKFFEYGKKIQPGRQYFCPRKEPDFSQDLPLIENQLILYGLDFKKLKVVKREYDTTEALRINESNFKLIYPDHQAAWRAIQKNAKDPSSLVKKVESEDSPLPRCWFEMTSYSVHNRTVQVYARFANENERNLQPQQEALMEIYRQCGEVYNEQEKKKREEELEKEAQKKEKIQLKRQVNSTRLYERYEDNADKEWDQGKNSNPGAKKDGDREHSRSRSRSKDKKNRMEGQVNDNSSNYSFILSKSKKDLKELNNALEDFRIKDPSVHGAQGDLSLDLIKGQGQEYNWNGGAPVTQGYQWSYRTYMQQKEEEEEQARRQKGMQAVVITIEDD